MKTVLEFITENQIAVGTKLTNGEHVWEVRNGGDGMGSGVYLDGETAYDPVIYYGAVRVAVIPNLKRVEEPKKKVKKWLWAYQNGSVWRQSDIFYSETEAAKHTCMVIKIPHTEIEVEDASS